MFNTSFLLKLGGTKHIADLHDATLNFSPLAAEIDSVVWGTPANFNGFRVLASLLHGILLVGISQTLRH